MHCCDLLKLKFGLYVHCVASGHQVQKKVILNSLPIRLLLEYFHT